MPYRPKRFKPEDRQTIGVDSVRTLLDQGKCNDYGLGKLNVNNREDLVRLYYEVCFVRQTKPEDKWIIGQLKKKVNPTPPEWRDEAIKAKLMTCYEEGLSTAEVEQRFLKEYKRGVVGNQDDIKRWLKRVPSACALPFDNYNISVFLMEIGIMDGTEDDTMYYSKIDAYWDMMAAHLEQLFMEYGNQP